MTALVPQVNIGGNVYCFFEIGFRFIGHVHNRVIPPRVGINVFFSVTLPLILRDNKYLITAIVGTRSFRRGISASLGILLLSLEFALLPSSEIFMSENHMLKVKNVETFRGLALVQRYQQNALSFAKVTSTIDNRYFFPPNVQ